MRPILASLLVCTLWAGDTVDLAAQAKLRKAAMEESLILRTLHFLTDRYGPRLTGSPNHKEAAEWAARQMTEWGLQNARLEPWNFGHDGWLNERMTAHIVAPVKDNLVGEVLAWTPSTKGVTRAQAIHVVPPQRPKPEELQAFLDEAAPRLMGKIVLVGDHKPVPVSFSAPSKRRDDAQVKAQYDPANPNPGRGGAGGPRGGGQQTPPGTVPANEVEQKISEMLANAGALVRVNNGDRDHGQIRAFHNRSYDLAKSVPTVILRSEDFGRIARLLADGTPVELEFNIQNRVYPEGKTSYNVVAEIPGTDRKDEIVMLGGHLDSWHSATGATDNAIGCAMMMEAARLIQNLGIKPRRTIRVALWSGEEQGLLGSKAYVEQHLGTVENPKAEAGNFVAYFNIDSGTGRPRGMSIFGPDAAAAVLRDAVKGFEDFGIFGASATRSRASGGTDSTSFNAAGFAGIGIQQDPIEYQSHTWHTNLDTYERIVPEDAQKAAAIIAAAVFHVAMRDERLPRFSKDEMPKPAPPRGATAETPTTPPQN